MGPLETEEYRFPTSRVGCRVIPMVGDLEWGRVHGADLLRSRRASLSARALILCAVLQSFSLCNLVEIVFLAFWVIDQPHHQSSSVMT